MCALPPPPDAIIPAARVIHSISYFFKIQSPVAGSMNGSVGGIVSSMSNLASCSNIDAC